MRAPRLRRCRSVWGDYEQRDALPQTRFVEDAIYLPEDDDGTWGLFAGGERVYYTGRGIPQTLFDGTFEKIECAPDGPYLYVGLFVLHYGHFLIETLSHFWPLLCEQEARPKILCHRLKTRPEGPEHAALYEMLAGLGVHREDVISFDRPVRVKHVVSAEAAFYERSYVHSVFGDVCRQIGQRHWKSDKSDTVSRPLYLSKTKLRSGVSQLLNEKRIEAELDRLGADIAFPEELTFGEQVNLISSYKYILGPTTSAFHTAAFAAPGRRIIGLNWSPQINSNYLLFDRLNDTRSYYYCAFKTAYSEAIGFGVGWSVPDPERIARELFQRVEIFDRLDERDVAEEARMARQANKPARQFRQWRRDFSGQLGRALKALRSPR